MLNLQRKAASHAVVTDGDDGLGDALVPDGCQLIDRSENRQAIDAPAVEGGVVVEETDGFVLLSSEENIEDDSPVSAGAQDDRFHNSISVTKWRGNWNRADNREDRRASFNMGIGWAGEFVERIAAAAGGRRRTVRGVVEVRRIVNLD